MKVEVTITATLNTQESEAIYKLIGNMSKKKDLSFGLTDEESCTLSQIYSAIDNALENTPPPHQGRE